MYSFLMHYFFEKFQPSFACKHLMSNYINYLFGTYSAITITFPYKYILEFVKIAGFKISLIP